jgi:2-deoxy-D-gluconate 3-dehydrogenase
MDLVVHYGSSTFDLCLKRTLSLLIHKGGNGMVLDRLRIDGRTAIVTGGGTGLGRAMSIALAEAGADITLAARRVERLEETASEVRKRGRRALVVPTDVTKSRQVNQMVARTISEFGKVDILVNNAGIIRKLEDSGATQKQMWEITDNDWHLGIDTNLGGAFFCSRAVAKHMVERKKGKIINVASGFGLRGLRNDFTYCCGKGGMIQLTRALAMTFARDGINANCIAPGLIWHSEQYSRPLSEEEIKESKKARGRFIPMGRVGESDEVGPLAVFLASDASDYVTGGVFIIDGGALSAGYAPTGYAPLITI